MINISGWSRLSAADQEGESKIGALKTARGNKTIFFSIIAAAADSRVVWMPLKLFT